MRKLYRSILSVLFAAFILVGGRAVLKAQQASSSAVKAGRWSDTATWPDKKVPAAGAESPLTRAWTWSWMSIRRRWAV